MADGNYYLLGDQETYKKLRTELDAHYSGPEREGSGGRIRA
jgi:hypothetical protein